MENFVRGFLGDRKSAAGQERQARARLLDTLSDALDARGTIAQMEAEIDGQRMEIQRQRGLLTEQTTRRVEQAGPKPENVDFVFHRQVNGLLSRVILKAEGFHDVAVDVIRGADNRMRTLKVQRPDTPASSFVENLLKNRE